MKDRQNLKTLEFWSFTLKIFVPWFLDRLLAKIFPVMQQDSIIRIGRTRTGKFVESKIILFMKSKYEIDQVERTDLVPSIVMAKLLDFFKAELLIKFKAIIFDDGIL